MNCPFVKTTGFLGHALYGIDDGGGCGSICRSEQWGCGVAYTYNEPLVGYEFVLIAVKVKESGMANVLVSNGFVSPKPQKNCCPMDAANIDLKCYNKELYKRF